MKTRRTSATVLGLLLIAGAAGCQSHSSHATATIDGPVGPSALVLVATLKPGARWSGLAESFITMPGVVATGVKSGTFTVSLRTSATVKQYMTLREKLEATPGVGAIVERTSTGHVFVGAPAKS